MPISTTLVTARSPPGPEPSRWLASQTWPTISAVSRLRLKPCGAGGAERAVERAADLRGDAQRAAADLGDEHRLDRLLAAAGAVGAQQPLAGAVAGGMLGDDLRRADLGDVGQPRAQLLAKIGHRCEVRDPALVDPHHQLARAERLLAEADHERLQLRGREPEEVGAAGGDGGHTRGLQLTACAGRARSRRRSNRSRARRCRPNRSRARRSPRCWPRGRRGSCRGRPSSDRWRP